MTDNAGLDRALQGTLDRLLDGRLAALRQELLAELKREAASLGGGAAGRGALAELNQIVTRILAPTGQTEIMGVCLQGAAAFAGRAVLFVRRGESFAFWRAERLTDSAASALRSTNLSAAKPDIFEELAASQQAVVKARPGQLSRAIEKALGESADGSMGLFPITVARRVVAALYADAANTPGSFQADAVQIITRVAGLSLETAAARAAAGASRTAAATTQEETAVPIAEEAHAPVSSPVSSLVEPALQATAEATPNAGSFAAQVPAPSGTEPSIPGPPAADSIAEADREAHKKAHRFARVAVQDLLSYHKNKIEKGRESGNLYSILKDDIDKTRENYRQRFGKTAARSFDYLHYELVLKLAGNDISSLGPQYPGAMEGD